jgi:hypothetical protein
VVGLHLSIIICCKQTCGKDFKSFFLHLAFCLYSYLAKPMVLLFAASWRSTVAIRWTVNYVPAAISITTNKVPKACDTTRNVAQSGILVLIFPLALFLVACVQVCMCFHFSFVIFIDPSPCCGQERMFCDWF